MCSKTQIFCNLYDFPLMRCIQLAMEPLHRPSMQNDSGWNALSLSVDVMEKLLKAVELVAYKCLSVWILLSKIVKAKLAKNANSCPMSEFYTAKKYIALLNFSNPPPVLAEWKWAAILGCREIAANSIIIYLLQVMFVYFLLPAIVAERHIWAFSASYPQIIWLALGTIPMSVG